VIFLDVSPEPGGVGTFAAVAFLLVVLGLAIVVFKLLKKSVKMAFRMVIVAVMAAIAIAGSAFFLILGSRSGGGRPVRPPRNNAAPR
jgi:hypothetical protein